MIFEIISIMLGIVKIIIFKLVYISRIKFNSLPKMNHTFKIAIKKGCKLIIGKNMRTRNNVSIRIYDNGVLKIGDNFFMNDNCSINCQESVEIGNNVMFGQNVMIFDHDHDYKNDIKSFITKKVTIGNNVWIGANVTILKGVSIGDNVVIGAGSVITKSIKPNSLCYCKNAIEKKEIINNN